MPLVLLLPDAAAGVTRALEQVLRRRPGAEDGPEHACKTGIPPPSRRFSSMADSWRRGASNVHDPGLDLNPKLHVDLRLDPNMCIQDGPGDLLPLVVRAREIGRAHRMWLSCHAHDDRLRPGENGLSQSGIEAEVSSASIVQLRARNDGCVHFKQYCVCVPVCWYRADLSKQISNSERACISGPAHPLSKHGHSLSAAHNRLTSRCRHAWPRTWPSGWGRECGRVAANSTACSFIKDHVSQPWGRVRGQGAAFEPPRAPTSEGRCLWIVARPVRSPDGPLSLVRRAMQPWHRNNTI